MKRILIVIVASLIGSQASALSCMQADIASSYLGAVASDERYAILVGQITYNRGNYSKEELEEGVDIPAQFVGRQLGRNSYSTPLTQDMTVNVGCFGPWCGYVNDSPNMISFVQIRDDGSYHLVGSPCPGSQYPADDPEIWRTLQMCLNGRECEARY